MNQAVGGRPITLFSAQWSDIELETLASMARAWGYDGLELNCSPLHYDFEQALSDSQYAAEVRKTLERYGLKCFALGAGAIGQAVCDRVDNRHRRLLPRSVWGDGDPPAVQQRAAQAMMDVARAASRLGVNQVNGFTGSSIWHLVYSFPPNDWDEVEAGYQDFADRWGPILDVFGAEGVRFGLEAHPTEIAYDFVTTRRAFDAVANRPEFGLNLDPSHLVHQGLDPALFAEEFHDRIYHVHIKDVRIRTDGRRSILGSHVNFGDPRRGWDFASPGHGCIDFHNLVLTLNRIGYSGPLSVEWEDSWIDREWAAADAIGFVRKLNIPPSKRVFDETLRPVER
jgi:sugar phosphate isomerase/epimerase